MNILLHESESIFFLPERIEVWELVEPTTVGEFLQGYSQKLLRVIFPRVFSSGAGMFITFPEVKLQITSGVRTIKFESTKVVNPLGIKEYLTNLSKIKYIYLRFGDKMGVFNYYYERHYGKLLQEYLEGTPLSPEVLPEISFPEKLTFG